MKELSIILRETLANTFLMYFKTHAFHWNVEGILFKQYHDFFGELYEDLHSTVDVIAEEMRAMNFYAPKNLSDIYRDATITENESIVGSDVVVMLNSLLTDNSILLDSYNRLFDTATALKQQGLADFAAGRIDVHKKHEWMIRSSIKP